jgi:hypothetical protein
VAAQGGLGVGHHLFELAHATLGGTFGRVGHGALRVVVDDRVGVQRVEREVLAGVTEVVLLAPPVEHLIRPRSGTPRAVSAATAAVRSSPPSWHPPDLPETIDGLSQLWGGEASTLNHEDAPQTPAQTPISADPAPQPINTVQGVLDSHLVVAGRFGQLDEVAGGAMASPQASTRGPTRAVWPVQAPPVMSGSMVRPKRPRRACQVPSTRRRRRFHF